MKSLLLVFFFVFTPLSLLAQTPPMPDFSYDEEETEEEGETNETDGDANEEIVQNGESKCEFVDWSSYFSMLDWSAWDNEVREWFEGCGEYATSVPPLPLGARYAYSIGVREVSSPFDVICPTLESINIDDIQTWGICVEEHIDANGCRTFCTLVGRTIVRKLAVPSSFNPMEWVLSSYDSPAWLYEDKLQTAQWFQQHDRSRIAMTFTVVPLGQYSAYTSLMATLAEEERQRRLEAEKDPTVFSFQRIDVGASDVYFEFYNPGQVLLTLLEKENLCDSWELYGRVGENTSSLSGYTTFSFQHQSDDQTHFFQIVDTSTDSDGDGLPDGLELNYFKSDPQKRDSRNSGLSDWEKVYVYGLDPSVRDVDEDGLIDGEEISLRTNPQKADTDGDGLVDGVEVDCLQPTECFTWLIPSETATQLPLTDTSITLATPVTIRGISYNKIYIDAIGEITLTSQENESLVGPTIATLDRRLSFNPDETSVLLFEETIYNDITCFTLTFKNLYVTNDTSANGTHLQIVLTPSVPDYIGINYLSVSTLEEANEGFATSIKWHQKELARYPKSGTITTQCSIIGTFGYGTNPLNADTDNDRLDDATEVLTVYSNPLVADTDNDRLLDGDEYYKHNTNPLSADSDDDTLPDWWEVQHGVDPLSSNGMDGKDGDPDGDAILNKNEYCYATNPRSSDTDNDGLTDSEEIGRIVIENSNVTFSTTGKQTLLSSSQNEDVLITTITLPTPICIRDFTYSKMLVSLDGRIILFNDTLDINPAIEGENLDLFNDSSNLDGFIIAAYWDDLYYLASLSDVYLTETSESYILHYDNVGIVGAETATDSVGTFKIKLPKAATENISIYYSNLSSLFNGASATIGIRTSAILENDFLVLQYSCNVANSISNNLALHFELGLCTNPINPDTDGDALLDGQEVTLEASPFCADTDGDGLPDDWEAKYGLNPVSAIGVDGANGDADDDGLKNSEEFAIKTSPTESDTDGDGFSDAEECGAISPLDMQGWINVSTLSKVIFNNDAPNVVFNVTITFNYVTYTYMSINRNGRIDLYTEMTPPQDLESQDVINCEQRASRSEQILLAPASSNLTFKDETSAILKGEVCYQGKQYYVIEYLKMAMNSAPQDGEITFQVLIPKEITPSTSILLNYGLIEGSFTESDLSIGFVSPTSKYGKSYNFSTNGASEISSPSSQQSQSSSSLSNQTLKLLFGYGSSPIDLDTDNDGLSDVEEYENSTNCYQPDSDNDMLSDNWEIQNELDPNKSNRFDNQDNNSYDEDPDGDGLTNLDEQFYRTNYLNVDSDGDGVNDKDEIDQCSHPLDPLDHGCPMTYSPIHLEFGDWSGSHSEKYALSIVPVDVVDEITTYHWINPSYGTVITQVALLKPNVLYEVTLKHSSTFLPSPDLDYTFKVEVPDGYFYRIEELDEGALGEFEQDQWGNKDRQFKVIFFKERLLWDVNRDGQIDPVSDGLSLNKEKSILYHWSNDDYDQGNCSDEGNASDVPRQQQGYLNINDTNFSDSRINGRADLLDFAPIWIDFESLLSQWPIAEGYTYKLTSSCDVGIVFTNLSKENVFAWHISDGVVFEKDGDEAISYEAPVYTIDCDGMILEEALFENFTSGVLMLEGQEPGGGDLKLTILKDNTLLSEATLHFSILAIESMYRRADLTACLTSTISPKAPELPTVPDAYFGATAPYVFFLHGFNVTATEARGWHAEMFKRLWQTGANLKFVGVTWFGEEGIFEAFRYHENVRNAFLTGAPLATLLSYYPNEEPIVMAHSLGNVAVASALQFYDANCKTFISLNAAVPAEAFGMSVSNALTYDECPATEQLFVPTAWHDYPCRSWCTNWHKLFGENRRENKLTWQNLFTPIIAKTNYINFYSSEDEVFELNAEVPSVFTGSALDLELPKIDGIFPYVHLLSSINVSLSRYAWQKQEVYKGRSSLIGSDIAGWSFCYIQDPEHPFDSYGNSRFIRKYPNGAATSEASDELLRTDPVFSTDGTPLLPLSSSEDVSKYPQEEYFELLALAIPSLTPAMGRPEGMTQNTKSIDMSGQKDGWGRESDILGTNWLHSDIKNMAFFYTYKVFNEIKNLLMEVNHEI